VVPQNQGNEAAVTSSLPLFFLALHRGSVRIGGTALGMVDLSQFNAGS